MQGILLLRMRVETDAARRPAGLQKPTLGS